jgi:hypothetical protein
MKMVARFISVNQVSAMFIREISEKGTKGMEFRVEYSLPASLYPMQPETKEARNFF